ncbi:hypothetical protein VTJ04DRAFT_10318 [Mycothermus thermophilus]|uniref:uncharacterized protein n=1 Tax=Humicola insolens TaxID=85995 RepID=UPI003742C2FC
MAGTYNYRLVTESHAGHGNENAILRGIICPNRRDGSPHHRSYLSIILIWLIPRTLSPRLHPLEPPLLRPRVPLIGHILGLIRHQANYHAILFRTTSSPPIATLPMLAGKMYVVWDPVLVAACLRNKALSTMPGFRETTPAITGVSPEATALWRAPEGERMVDKVMREEIPKSLQGEEVKPLEKYVFERMGQELVQLLDKREAVEIPNLYLWLRDMLTDSTAVALYGEEHNPFKHTARSKEQDPAQALWVFESNLISLTLPFPKIFARTAYKARKCLVKALAPYYLAEHDLGAHASAFVRRRGAGMREAGLSSMDIARFEILLPFAALANTVPALFWTFWFVFCGGGNQDGKRETLLAKLRKEVEDGLIVKVTGSSSSSTVSTTSNGSGVSGEETQGGGNGGRNEVTLLINASTIESRCPLLVSCYKETMRHVVHQISTRTATCTMVQLAIGVGHAMEEYWGSDVQEIDLERFVRKESLGKSGDVDGPGSARMMRAAFQPFGGGIHHCPGRRLAFVR